MKTYRLRIYKCLETSPPSRRRGLKNILDLVRYQRKCVASFAEAWIEKEIVQGCTFFCESPPSRRRGLKKTFSKAGTADYVASFAEAWIENLTCLRLIILPDSVASFAEAWIEKQARILAMNSVLVASFAEAWIENYKTSLLFYSRKSPPSRRRGLKNKRGF